MKKKTQRGAAAAGSRPAKVGELIRQELSSMFQDGWVRDPRFSAAFVTVTGVTMSADLSHGTVHVSVYSEDREIRDGVMWSLTEAARDLRRELGRRLTIRHTPELRFAHDGSAAYGEKMERLLKDIRIDAAPSGPPSTSGTIDDDGADRTDPDISALDPAKLDPDAIVDDPGERTNPDAIDALAEEEEGEDTPAEAAGIPPEDEGHDATGRTLQIPAVQTAIDDAPAAPQTTGAQGVPAPDASATATVPAPPGPPAPTVGDADPKPN